MLEKDERDRKRKCEKEKECACFCLQVCMHVDVRVDACANEFKIRFR